MKLASLLQIHRDSAHPHGLAGNFGDGYLIRNNLVYRNIRQFSLEFGFKYSDKPDADYLAFPMGQLESVLGNKLIPFTDNVTALENLNQKANTIEWDHIADNLKPNYMFHESCHAVARTCIETLAAGENELQLKLTRTLLEESFANTCELFAVADAKDQVHRNFLELNSYFTLFEIRTNLINLIENTGFKKLFKLVLLCYVHSNFLNEQLPEPQFKKFLQFAGVGESAIPAGLRSLIKHCFELNPNFRYTTTEMYLRTHKMEIPVEEALNFDYLSRIKNNEQIRALIDRLSDIAGATNER
jgi:serine/threonine protein kinase